MVYWLGWFYAYSLLAGVVWFYTYGLPARVILHLWSTGWGGFTPTVYWLGWFYTYGLLARVGFQ